ncbi:MAG: hypothetical protein SOZ00_05720 [Tidjanibacter sp.]|nr:hypothetical protein [Tidjanibacter sp.]
MKKTVYATPEIRVCSVSVEVGIAFSIYGTEINFDDFTDEDL